MIYRNGYGPIDRFCAKHPRFGISNLMLYIVIGQVAVFILDLFFRGMLSSYWLPFSRDLILHGQVWRLVTFIFLPSDSGNPFFLLLGCYFYYWIGTMLEREWGTARFTLFYLSGVVLSVLSGMILGITDIYYINLSIFLVIATLYGEMQVLLFFVIPIKMKWMALIDVALILVAVIQNLMYGSWVGALLPLASFVNYFIFTWPFWGAEAGAETGQGHRRLPPQVRCVRHYRCRRPQYGVSLLLQVRRVLLLLYESYQQPRSHPPRLSPPAGGGRHAPNGACLFAVTGRQWD